MADERIGEVKRLVEQYKCAVRDTNEEMHQHRLKQGVMPVGRWHELRNRISNRLRMQQKLLGEAKAELSKLSGTTGGDPKWAMLVTAYRVLHRLDEAGTDIGKDGQKLLDDLEFHVPLAKLAEAIEQGAEECEK